MSERFTVEVDITAKDKTQQALKGAKTGFQEAFGSVKQHFHDTLQPAKLFEGAMMGVASSITGMAMQALQQIPAVAQQMVELGIRSQAVTHRFEAFAGGSREAAQYLDAFQDATGGTISKMDAMAGASKMLQMGLVSNASEMSTMAAIATRLGDQTMGAGERLADFSALLANRSIPRLDNFGISSGIVRERVEELKQAGYGLDEAFKLAVLEQGRLSLEKLGDTSEQLTTKIDIVKAAWADAKQEMAEMTVESLEGARGTDELAQRIRDLPAYFDNLGYALQRSGGNFMAFYYHLNTAAKAEIEMRHAIQEGTSEIERYAHTIPAATESFTEMSFVSDEVEASLHAQVQSQGMLMHTVLAASDAIRREGITSQDELMRTVMAASDALEDQEQAARDTAKALTEELSEASLHTAMQYASYEQDVTETAEQFAEQREEIEREHQEKLAQIAAKGQGQRVRVDEEEVHLELRIAQGRLQELLERQAKYNEETTDLERARTEQAIRNLQDEVAEKTRILEAAQDGYLWRTGQNVDELIAEENRHYAESLSNLEEAQADQEAAQRQSLGRMVLAHFNAWVEMNLASDGFTQEEARFVSQMRTEISREYGLITETALQEMADQEREWAATMAIMTGEAENFFAYFMQQFNALPDEKTIHIRTSLATPEVAEEGRLGGEVMQRGAAFAPGGYAWVGERGPELAYIPRGAAVYPADQSRHMTNHYNLTVHSSSTAGRISDEFALMESLAV